MESPHASAGADLPDEPHRPRPRRRELTHNGPLTCGDNVRRQETVDTRIQEDGDG